MSKQTEKKQTATADLTQAQIMRNQLAQYQAMPLSAKVKLSKKRIEQWLEHWEDGCYVAFSGGRDSTVLLDLVWSINPRIPAVFVDTGLEYPEIREFVKSYGDRVVWLKPKMRFDKVIEKYGFPVISKDQSMAISRCRATKSEKVRIFRRTGVRDGVKVGNKGVVSKKWHFLLDSNIPISDKCCDVMKKQPMKAYEKQFKSVPFVGVRATESRNRSLQYEHYGCASFDTAAPQSRPLAFWTGEDVVQYLKENKVPYSKIYDMGEDSTGCMFCGFGVCMEKGTNRFQRMYVSHPKKWDYCINKLGLGEVLDFIGVKYVPDGIQTDLFDVKKEEVV